MTEKPPPCGNCGAPYEKHLWRKKGQCPDGTRRMYGRVVEHVDEKRTVPA